ncbi:hypothetical protein AV656_08165 [Bhargavaea cecembensis]|uniref:Tripartite ATP-independent periplasmic transporters DctQ component domain-containing protein n=1 Tax=Bhargavaea cecembensis TaxID=394098 RepID=A0A163FKM8_9BACL|nr:TRAP transporter small permease [Bhargavaea cecembensis]KZE38866.1 hypothetical protein AV656_08165 [Bhargavaea cecembensis]
MKKGSLVMVKNASSLENTSGDGSLFNKFSSKLNKLAKGYNRILHGLSCILLFAMMFLTVFDVLGRNLFNSPIVGTYELTGFALAITIFFSLGAAQLKGDHIEVDFLFKKLPERAQHICNAGIYLILTFVVMLTSWQLWVYAQRLMQGHNVSGDLGIPIYVIAFLTTFGAIGFFLTLLNSFVQSLMKAVEAK